MLLLSVLPKWQTLQGLLSYPPIINYSPNINASSLGRKLYVWDYNTDPRGVISWISYKNTKKLFIKIMSFGLSFYKNIYFAKLISSILLLRSFDYIDYFKWLIKILSDYYTNNNNKFLPLFFQYKYLCIMA